MMTNMLVDDIKSDDVINDLQQISIKETEEEKLHYIEYIHRQ